MIQQTLWDDNLFNNSGNPLNDRVITLAGDFDDRAQLRETLKGMGAILKPEVTKNVNYILIGENPRPKKMHKLEKLIHDGYHVRQLYMDDLQNIIQGHWDEYRTEKVIVKDLDFTIGHYDKHHLAFEGMTNMLSGREIFLGKGLRPRIDYLMQMLGNLGAFSSTTLDESINLCLLSNPTLEGLRNGEKDETIRLIQDFYNANKNIVFDFEFISEQEVLDWVRMRCERAGDDVTMKLFDNYMKN